MWVQVPSSALSQEALRFQGFFDFAEEFCQCDETPFTYGEFTRLRVCEMNFDIVGIFGNFIKIKTTFELYVFWKLQLTFSG